MSTTPIADYALLSDRHSAALVSRNGSIDWLCFPRFDSPSIFGRILGEQAGYWSMVVTDASQVTRRYLDRSMVLETTYRTPRGVAAISDALAMGEGNRGHELGRRAPHLLLRRATCLEGEVELRLAYVPRPEYGLVHPLLDTVDGGVTATGGADVLVLSSPSALAVNEELSTVSGLVRLRGGESAGFALHHSKRSEEETARVWSQSEIGARFDDTLMAWESWSELHQAYEGPWRDLVHHSGRVLQALSFSPTGAICAAATTSLPETVGGSRNWDYRYAWVRDASFTIQALWVAACPDEANSKLMCWVALDRATALADRLDVANRVESWKQTEAQIREAILTRGWSDRANAFTQSFGSDDLDASSLMLSLVGFLPADDSRVLATIKATEERLTDERGLVYRYRSHDGLEGEEGTFLLCTFWLAQALAGAGQPARARTVFERAAAFVNDVGLLAEEVDRVNGELLGNFPQAFSHIGLVNAAWAISESELRQTPPS